MHSNANPTAGRARTALALLVGLAIGTVALARQPETPGIPDHVLPPQAQGQPPSWAGKAFRQGVVAVANPYGAEAGAKVLEAGGNAVDAAVAIAYALNVVEPQSAGVGGGGFMMIHLAGEGRTFAIDSRERAPAGATPNMFSTLSFTNASTSGIAVGVPGMVKATAMAIEEYGRLSLAKVLEPAIALAEGGFAATPRYNSASCSSRARVYPETAAFFCPGGVAPPVGSIIKNQPLADTFKAIAKDGPKAFYEGDVAKGIVEGQKRIRPDGNGRPGTMTLDDLGNYEVSIREVEEATYRGYRIKAMSSPSSGGLTLLQMLKLIERFPVGDASQGYGFGSFRTVNVMVEAMRLAFADRSVWMGDADFAYVPAKGLLADPYTESRSALIDPIGRIPNAQMLPGDPRPWDMAEAERGVLIADAAPFAGPGGSTTHFSVVDKWGNVVSYTNTIESSHGAGMFAGYTLPDGSFRSFGFLLNNELTDFNFTPAFNPPNNPGANDVAPGKRPRSSMVPTMIFTPSGEPLVALGSPGGSTIINSVFNTVLNLIDHRMDLQDAINAPRVSATTSPAGTISCEGTQPYMLPKISVATQDALRAVGHAGLGTVPGVDACTAAEIGSVQAVIVDLQTGKQYGGADPRREGTVIGLPRPQGR